MKKYRKKHFLENYVATRFRCIFKSERSGHYSHVIIQFLIIAARTTTACPLEVLLLQHLPCSTGLQMYRKADFSLHPSNIHSLFCPASIYPFQAASFSFSPLVPVNRKNSCDKNSEIICFTILCQIFPMMLIMTILCLILATVVHIISCNLV